MSRIIKPSDAPASRKGVMLAVEEPAVKVDTKKGKIAEERNKRLEEAKNKPDQEYLELFETVKGLIVNQEYWELVPDQSLQKVYAYVSAEMKKRGVMTPKLPEEAKVETKEN